MQAGLRSEWVVSTDLCTQSVTLFISCLQDRYWVVYGGSVEGKGYHNDLNVFDFRVMRWIRTLSRHAELGYRTGHMMTCHQGQILIVGGVLPCHLLLEKHVHLCMLCSAWLLCIDAVPQVDSSGVAVHLASCNFARP